MADNAERLWMACHHSVYVKQQLGFARAAVQAENTALLLLDDAGENLVFCASVGEHSERYTGGGGYEAALRVSMSEGIGMNPLAVLYSKPMSMEQPDARHNPAIDRAIGTKTRSLYTVPLAGPQITLGTFSTINVHEGASAELTDKFQPGDIEALQAVGEALNLWISREWEKLVGNTQALRSY
jgi:hypothetical protein